VRLTGQDPPFAAQSTTGTIDTHDFLLEPDNVAPIITFLKKTGIGFTKSLRCDHSGKEETTETEGDNSEIADLEVEAFEGYESGYRVIGMYTKIYNNAKQKIHVPKFVAYLFLCSFFLFSFFCYIKGVKGRAKGPGAHNFYWVSMVHTILPSFREK
jgi:hypothetical protein